MSDTLVTMGPLDRAQLEQCEEVIARGIQTFYEVGTALAEIRDSRLYRAAHDTFEDYLSERWGISRTRAYELISAATVQDEVSAIADIPNEAIARELVKAPQDRRSEVWEEATAVASGRPTAKLIKALVKKITSRNDAGGRITSHIAACGFTGNPNAMSEDDPTGHRLPLNTGGPREDVPVAVSEPPIHPSVSLVARATARLSEAPTAPVDREAALDHARQMIADDPNYARALHWALGEELGHE